MGARLTVRAVEITRVGAGVEGIILMLDGALLIVLATLGNEFVEAFLNGGGVKPLGAGGVKFLGVVTGGVTIFG